MNLSTIQISKSEAMQKLVGYKGLNARQKTLEDTRLESLYNAVKNGARVIDVSSAFKETPLNDKGQPKLAIARADWKRVYFHPRCWVQLSLDERTINSNSYLKGAGTFTDNPRFNDQGFQKSVSLPAGTFGENLKGNIIHSAVPHVPPNIRPPHHLRNYYILFEVENWETYPVDPFLLKRIHNNLFVVLAEWELTALEAALLGSMI